MGFSNIYDSITGNDQITKPNKTMEEKKKKHAIWHVQYKKFKSKKYLAFMLHMFGSIEPFCELSAKLNIYEHQLKKWWAKWIKEENIWKWN